MLVIPAFRKMRQEESLNPVSMQKQNKKKENELF
jgi:hypothetical protein